MNDTIKLNHLTPEDFLRKADIANQNTRNTRSCEESFFNIEINNLTLENRHIIRADFNYSKITNVTFRAINFEGTEFNFSDLQGVVFDRCKLLRSSFDFAKMKNVKFVDCNNFRSSFDFASGEVGFTRCVAEGMEFHHVKAETELNFSECAGQCIEFNFCPDLRIYAEDCDFHQGQFNDSRIRGQLSNCILTDSDFLNSDCIGVEFVGCKMRDVNIDGSTGVVCGKNEEFAPLLCLTRDFFK